MTTASFWRAAPDSRDDSETETAAGSSGLDARTAGGVCAGRTGSAARAGDRTGFAAASGETEGAGVAVFAAGAGFAGAGSVSASVCVLGAVGAGVGDGTDSTGISAASEGADNAAPVSADGAGFAAASEGADGAATVFADGETGAEPSGVSIGKERGAFGSPIVFDTASTSGACIERFGIGCGAFGSGGGFSMGGGAPLAGAGTSGSAGPSGDDARRPDRRRSSGDFAAPVCSGYGDTTGGTADAFRAGETAASGVEASAPPESGIGVAATECAGRSALISAVGAACRLVSSASGRRIGAEGAGVRTAPAIAIQSGLFDIVVSGSVCVSGVSFAV
jgi:hypothetical protein